MHIAYLIYFLQNESATVSELSHDVFYQKGKVHRNTDH